jgi:hypothetical protein
MEAQAEAMNQQRKKEFDAEKTKFRAMVDRASEDKSMQYDLAKEAMRISQENRQTVLDKLSDIQRVAEERIGKESLTVLQGQIDAVLEGQKQMHEQIMQTKELASAEREAEVTERDQKGKVKKTVSRVKKKGS